jgi:hypothetical protein
MDVSQRKARHPTRLSWLLAALLGVFLLMAGLDASAQGCSQCRVVAEAARSPEALNLAIVVLLIPTLSIFASIVVWAFRHQDSTDASPRPSSTMAHPITSDRSERRNGQHLARRPTWRRGERRFQNLRTALIIH